VSYTIAIVNFRLPERFQDACDLIDGLVGQDTDQVEPVFQRFYDEVTKLYPCLLSLSDDELEQGVWSDGPLINNFKVKVPVVGFVYSKAQEAAPAVCHLALSMGLSILDWQSGLVRNPS
jgi:hypothetical protein